MQNAKIVIKIYHQIIKLSFLLIFCTLFYYPVSAQSQNESTETNSMAIMVSTKANGDSIVVRWAPSSPVAWRMTSAKGFTVKRLHFKQEGGVDTVLLNEEPIRPMPLETMKLKVDKSNKYIAAMAQGLYGQQYSMGNKPPSGLIEKVQQANDMFTMRFYFAMLAADFSPAAATVGGLRFVDKNVEKNAFYAYIVTSDTTADGIKILGGIDHVLNINTPVQPPEGLIGKSYDKKIELNWYRSQIGNFTAYNIQRSSDNGKTWKQINDEPFTAPYDEEAASDVSKNVRDMALVLKDNQVFFDSITENYKDFYYRISGIDAFGEESAFCESIILHGIDMESPDPAQIDSLVNIKFNHVLITWKKTKIEPDFAGFYVQRGDNAKGPFFNLYEEMLPKNRFKFIDTTASALQENFYVVVTVDTAGNESYSIPQKGALIDSIPPKAPINVSGHMDSLGFVYLTWKQNDEPDLNGYKVYTSYRKDNDYVQVTHYQLKQNGYIDSISLKSLDRRIYYKVVAVDKNGNHSAYSEPASINKIIVIPPKPPIAQKIFMDSNTVVVEFIGSYSEGLSGYEVFRQERVGEWKSLGLISFTKGGLFNITDSSTKYGINYAYAVESIDSTGIRSEKSFPISIRSNVDQELTNPVSNLKAVYDEESKTVKLSWKPSEDDDYFYIIYRGTNNHDLMEWQSVDKNKTNFTDAMVTSGISYQYSIKVMSNNKRHSSKLAPIVVVNIPLHKE